MKKILALILAFTMVATLCACGNGNNGDVNEGETNKEETNLGDTNEEEANQDESEKEEPKKEETDKDENLTLGGKLKKQFVEITDSGETDPIAIAEEIITNEAIEFAPIVMEVEPGTFLQGITLDEVTGFEKGAMFGPMIGSIPFVGYIFSLAEDADIDGFIKSLTDNADLRWNVCVSADEMHAEKSGSTVFFLMSPLSLETEIPQE